MSMISVLLFLSVTYPHSPQKAVLLSAFLPGGGQFYTHRYLRGAIIGGGEIALGTMAYLKHRDNNTEGRDQYLYYLAFLIGFSMADAYVGALVYNFDIQMDEGQLEVGYRWRW